MGPVEFVVLGFPGATPGAGAIKAMAGLRRSGALRVLDTLLVAKAADGTVSASELADVPELSDLVLHDDSRLIAADDADEVAVTLTPGTCALLALVEQTWAATAAEAVRESGGELVASVRIPAQVVDEVLAATGAS
jgi:uncharacterized membrane protein